MKRYAITKSDEKLISSALATLEKAFDGGEKHVVGAAVKTADGKIFTGVNCDGIHGSCAEYIAIGKAISEGETNFDTIVAVHLDAPNNVVSPCGNCRQLMHEYCPDIKVILNDGGGNMIKVSARDLLPFAYSHFETIRRQ